MAAITGAIIAGATAISPVVTTAAALYGLGSAIEADKQRGESARKEGEAIAQQKATALNQRKNMIDKQRIQLMGEGDGKYKTRRNVGIPTGVNEVSLG